MNIKEQLEIQRQYNKVKKVDLITPPNRKEASKKGRTTLELPKAKNN